MSETDCFEDAVRKSSSDGTADERLSSECYEDMSGFTQVASEQRQNANSMCESQGNLPVLRLHEGPEEGAPSLDRMRAAADQIQTFIEGMPAHSESVLFGRYGKNEVVAQLPDGTVSDAREQSWSRQTTFDVNGGRGYRTGGVHDEIIKR